jgi:hypothetical protein
MVDSGKVECMEGRRLVSDGDVDGGIARLLVAVEKGFDEAKIDLVAAYELAAARRRQGRVVVECRERVCCRQAI